MTRQRSDEQRKAQIRAAATRCFVRRGFGATRLLDIAREAGLSKGGVYFHYRAKEQLFHDILENHLERMANRWSFAPVADQPADVTLGQIIMTQLRTMEDEPDETRLFNLLVTMAVQEPAFRQKLEDVTEVMRDLYSGVIERGMGEGVFSQGDARSMAVNLVSMVNGYSCASAMHPEGHLPLRPEQVAEHAVRMLRAPVAPTAAVSATIRPEAETVPSPTPTSN